MKEESEKEEQKAEETEQQELTEEAVEEIEEAAETLKKEEEAEEEKVEVEEQLPPAAEEVKLPLRKEIEEEIVEERIYTIPLGKAWIAPPNRRAPRAIRIIKDFVKRHMKLEARGEAVMEEEEPKRLIISNEVNERVWRKGIEKPPRKVRVRSAKDKDGNVTVYLAEGD